MTGKKNIPRSDKKSIEGGKENGNTLWQGVTHSVKPLTRGKNRILDHSGQAAQNPLDPDSPSSPPLARPKSARSKPARLATPPSGLKHPTLPRTVQLTHGLAPGLDKRTNLRLIRGQIPIEATLDMHGHTMATGHRALEAFINAAFQSDKRCVLVITGKGLRLTDGDVGVLRQNVPIWLNDNLLRPKVLAFSYATQRDGGQGALYILLKRRR